MKRLRGREAVETATAMELAAAAYERYAATLDGQCSDGAALARRRAAELLEVAELIRREAHEAGKAA